MKTVLCVNILAVLSAVMVPFAVGQAKQSPAGTIVNVQKQDVATPPVRTGAPLNHAPLQSHYFVYNVSVQLNCDVYVGRYETELDDLPSTLSPNNSVPVRVMRHLMYLDFPGDSVKMQIVQHRVSTACGKTATAKLRCIRMLWLLKSSRPQPIEGMVARDGQEVVARNGKRLCSLRWGLEAVFPLQIAPQFDIGTLETIIVIRSVRQDG